MTETTTEASTSKKGYGVWIVLGIILIAAAAAGGYFWMNKEGMMSTPVARVNGAEISQEDYDRSVKQIENAFAAQGMDPASAEVSATIKNQALTTLINRQLIIEAATKAGVTVSDEEVETEYQNVLAGLGGEAGLAAALTETGMTEDGLRGDIRNDVMINKYLETKGLGAASVTDAEIEATYAAAASSTPAGSENALPPFEEVKELIRGQLVNDKRQVMINSELETLRTNATIEILI